jgi:SAM-dependent methyltransferase
MVATTTIPSCHLYALDPSRRIKNELLELEIDPSSSEPTEVLTLNKIDGMRYEGDVGTCIFKHHLDTSFSADTDINVLDVGSGFGGPSRLLALKRPKTALVALEYIPEISNLAQALTQRCPEVADRVTHVTGDVTQLNDDILGTCDQFHAAQGVLSLLHVPDLQTALNKICDRLIVGGFIYIEDFWVENVLTLEAQSYLMERVGCPRMPLSEEEWTNFLHQAGFDRVTFQDVTSSWQPWIHRRAEEYGKSMDRHERVHGKQCAKLMLEFYQTMDSLFTQDLKGCRILAVKSK